MLRTAFLALAFAAAGLVAGCSTPCDKTRTCSLDSSKNVCDGNSFAACTEANAGERITCPNMGTTRYAVCTPSGWTFQSSP